MTLSDQEREAFRHLYLFEHFDDLKYREIMDHAKLIELPAGEILFAEGDPCHHFYLVRRGMIKLFKSSSDGSEKILEFVTPKQILGEDAMFVGQHSVYADALEPTQLIAFECGYFAGLLRENIDLCLRLMTLMSHRSQNMLSEIGNLTLQSGIQRVVQYLIQTVDASQEECTRTIHLSLPKNVIASRLGVKPETFSRIIHRLRSEGIIDCIRNVVLLKNMHSLQQIANGMIWLKL